MIIIRSKLTYYYPYSYQHLKGLEFILHHTSSNNTNKSQQEITLPCSMVRYIKAVEKTNQGAKKLSIIICRKTKNSSACSSNMVNKIHKLHLNLAVGIFSTIKLCWGQYYIGNRLSVLDLSLPQLNHRDLAYLSLLSHFIWHSFEHVHNTYNIENSSRLPVES